MRVRFAITSRALSALGLAIGLLIAAQPALACACCTNTGQRNVKVAKLDAGKREEIGSMRFGPVARLYSGERDVADSVKGIKTPSDRYDLSVSQSKDHLVFALRDSAGRAGTLTLAAPDSMSIFEVDPRDTEGPQGPTLYKEWKITSNVAGTGILALRSGGKERLTLVLHGRGNSCASASDFSHWTLVVSGPQADYLLYGELLR